MCRNRYFSHICLLQSMWPPSCHWVPARNRSGRCRCWWSPQCLCHSSWGSLHMGQRAIRAPGAQRQWGPAEAQTGEKVLGVKARFRLELLLVLWCCSGLGQFVFSGQPLQAHHWEAWFLVYRNKLSWYISFPYKGVNELPACWCMPAAYGSGVSC